MREVSVAEVVPQQLRIELKDVPLILVGHRGLLEEHASIREGNGA